MDEVVERFLRYSISDNTNETVLSLNSLLQKEMIEIGMEDVKIDENGNVIGYIPSTMKREVATVGFFAFMDEANSYAEQMIQLTSAYHGNDIVINKITSLSTEENPELKNYINDTIITFDRHDTITAKHKLGVAEIMSSMKCIIDTPELQHGRIGVCFLADNMKREDIAKFAVKTLGIKYAYFLQANNMGELRCDNFNKAIANVCFKGRDDKGCKSAINAIHIAKEFMEEIPQKELKERSTGYEGYYNLSSITGAMSEAHIEIELCDFDKERFEWRKGRILNGISEFTKRYDLPVDFTITDQFYNRKDKIEQVNYIVEIAKRAMDGVQIKPIVKPYRGVPQSAKLTYMGLPTIDLWTGVYNGGTKLEYIPTSVMQKSVEVIVKIVELCGQI
ncbi:MAG: tripeptide aminopeptidase PepT [Marinifilaceae bacterium]